MACVVPVPVVDVGDGVSSLLQVLAHAARPLLAFAGRPVALVLVLAELLWGGAHENVIIGLIVAYVHDQCH